MHKVIFIIGVSGCGKTTVGKLISERFDIPFFDGDDFHPQANIKKMSDGIPLNDADREPWLIRLNDLARNTIEKTECVIACSALKESYRSILQREIGAQVVWVHLDGSLAQIAERLEKRAGHFMPESLLQSQFDILEQPHKAITINIGNKPKDIVDMIEEELKTKAEIGLFGLGVMGKSLSRNIASKGFSISLFNRHVNGTEENVASDFVNAHQELSKAMPFDDVEKFVESLRRPRKIVLMVNAGKTTDIVIDSLVPHLQAGDILIDGGNSNYIQTNTRERRLKEKGMFFIGSGVSGGEEGALKGPSIMPGGDQETYKKISYVLEAISAKDKNGDPCCSYIGPQGAGHFVKMIHNGIEYVEMQLLCEAYGILRSAGSNPDEIANVFESWMVSSGSYLLGITIEILRRKEGESWLLDKIMDKAGNKGTGNWATIASAQLGVPSTLIASALYARYTSFYKDQRRELSKEYGSESRPKFDIKTDDLLLAYNFARIINHYQGFKVMSVASSKYDWNLNLSEIARIWTNGCIIRSDLMMELIPILKESNDILSHHNIVDQLQNGKKTISNVVSICLQNEVSVPCLSEAINFFFAISTENSSANLIQAQRDYFGAHTYQRRDDDSEKFYHTDWSNKHN